jgi:hypothetical protein
LPAWQGLSRSRDSIQRRNRFACKPPARCILKAVVASRRRNKDQFVVVVRFACVLFVAILMSACLWPFGNNGDGEHRTGPDVIIARGRHGDAEWTLSQRPSNLGFCLHLNSGGGCGLPGNAPLSLLAAGERFGDRFVRWEFGRVSKDVVKVVVTLTGGRTIEVLPVGKALGFPWNFYVIEIPDQAEAVETAVFDKEGRLLDRTSR